MTVKELLDQGFYNEAAKQFAKENGITLIIKEDCKYGPYFPDDKQSRFIFTCVLKRNKKRYTFTYGQSIAKHNKKPDMYSILSVMTKYDPGDFEMFCSHYGYDTDSRNAHKIYISVVKEYEAMKRLFIDFTEEQWDEFREIG